MMSFVSSFMILVQEHSCCFTRPSFDSILILLQGWILPPRRTITGMILSAGVPGAKHHSVFHRVCRTAPMALLLYSLTVIWFTQTGHAFYAPLHRPWYLSKRYPSFADMLATLKIQSLKESFDIPATDADLSKPLQFLIRTLKIAA
jgi:hypothetical protein